MTEEQRVELERLKKLQVELHKQLLDFGGRVEAFEKRLTETPPTAITGAPFFTFKSDLKIQPPPTLPELVPMPLEPVALPLPEEKEAPPIAPPVIAKVERPQSVPPPQIAHIPAAASTILPPPPIPQPAPVQAQATLPKTPKPEPARQRGSFEMRLGTFWLVRVGIVLLLTGLVFFGNFAYHNFVGKLPPGGKVGLLYGACAVLLAAGTWLQRRPELKNFSQVLLAGGLAAVYFTTFAAHHVEQLKVIASPVVDGSLLLAWACFTIWLADRRKSEVMALLAVLLAYYTSIITQVGLFTLYSNLVLTAAAVFFLVRNRWAALSFVSVAATYVSYAFWRFFHNDHWQWADPGEGLWTGNYFLIGYWILFTVAVFLSKHEQFTGGRRPAFLSLNNIAFFTAFILTMLQVHQGGFWKFALVYGGILLALAVLARKVLPNDKASANAYLIQGLLLVTLGFLNYYTGLRLSLVLAAESVALVTLGRQLKSRVMDGASLLTALLAVGWGFGNIHHFDNNGLLMGGALGIMMIFNAFWLRRDITFDQSIFQKRTIFYTTLALAIWLYTTWQNAADEWRGLILAGESAVLILASRPLRNKVLNAGAWAFGFLAAGSESLDLGNQFISIHTHGGKPGAVGLVPAIALGAVLLFNALAERRLLRPLKDEFLFQPPVTLFTCLSLLCWLGATVVFAGARYLAPLLALEALLFTAAWHLLRVREITLFGQGFLVLAQSLWFYDFAMHHATRPWWNAVVVIAVTLAVATWWQRQKSLKFKEPVGLMFQGVFALAVVCVFYLWLLPEFSAPAWIGFTSLLAVSLTAYGAFTGFWLLAAAAQLLLLASGCEFASLLYEGQPAWYLSLAPIISLGLLSFSALKWLEQHSKTPVKFARPVLEISRGYRVIAVAMSLWWVHKYIDSREQCWALALVGLVLFAIGAWRRNRETLAFSAVFTLSALTKIWLPSETTPMIYWPNLLVILLALAQQQFARRRPANCIVPSMIHIAAVILGGLTLWLYVSRWILEGPEKFFLTIGWSVLALALFLAGITLRERSYRWLGLGVLACALGRIAFIDVWHWDTIYRFLSFMALGIVLIVLSFIYNRYQEKIREWL